MRVDRALDKLRLALARRGVTSTAAALGLLLTQQAVTAAPAGLAASASGTALAAVAAGGAANTFASFFQFMTMSKIQAGTAGLIALAAIGTLFLEHRENERLEAEIAGARQETAALRRENERLATVAAQTERGRPATEMTSTPMSLIGAPDGPRTFTASAGVQEIAFKLDDAETARLMDIQSKGRLEARFGALLRQLNLSPEKSELLKKLLLDRQNVTRDVINAGHAQGLDPAQLHADLSKMIEQTNAGIDASIRQLLG